MFGQLARLLVKSLHACLVRACPRDRIFYNSRASNSGYRRFWTSENWTIDGFGGSKIVKCLVRQTTTCQALVCLGEELLERAELKNVTNCDLWLQDMSSVEPDRTFRSFRGSIDEFSQNKNRQLALKSQKFRPEEQKGEQEQKTNLSTYACKLKKNRPSRKCC